MAAAAAGKSTLGIPAKVGKEFEASDKGGKLPAVAKPKGGGGWRSARKPGWNAG